MNQRLQFTQGKEEKATYFAEILVPVPVRLYFTYRIPENLLEEAEVGKRVSVPFGRNRILTGIIGEIHDRVPSSYEAKFIIDIIDDKPAVDLHHLKFWQWMADYYLCTPGEVMEAALPASMMLQSETRISLHPYFELEEQEAQLTPNEKEIIHFLKDQKEATLKELTRNTGKKNLMPVVKRLVEKELISVKREIQEGYKPAYEKQVSLNPDLEEEAHLKEVFHDLENAPKQSDMLMMYLVLRKKKNAITKKELVEQSKGTDGVFKSLKDKGILHEEAVKKDRLTTFEKDEKATFTLTDAQQQALDEIRETFRSKSVVLLYGITGSGKTHLYIRWMEELIAQGKQILYMVPEIGLSAQLIRRLKAFFGNEIGIYHSRFNNQERYEIWQKVRDKEYKIVLGVRSAVFLPFQDLGGVIVDEEHETTFRQHDPAPRYHARDSSIVLANQFFGGKVLLGSATPSFESYFNGLKGKFGLVYLNHRFQDIKMPQIDLADLKKPYRDDTMKSHLTPFLYKSAKSALEGGRQVVFFQNRRGYAPLLECGECGWVPYCDNCDISMTYHQMMQKLICHYCGAKKNLPSHCNSCGNAGLGMKSFGTEKIEDELPYFFPDRGIIRLDQDTTRGKESFDNALKKFERGEKEVMVGTQMITKGLDFENLYLVGILNADQLLHYPDFRARERAFQLMLQVGGRAGRKKEKGQVIIQTFMPEHPIFSYLQIYDYRGFFENEIRERKQFYYPPFCRLLKITFRHPDKKRVQEAALLTGKNLRKYFGKHLLGPEFPPAARIKNQYINEILIKAPVNQKQLKESKEKIRAEIDHLQNHPRYKQVRVTPEADPM